MTLEEAAERILQEQTRPSVLLRPRLFPEGPDWCALYGDDISTGLAGFGATPDEAFRDFDRAWLEQRVPRAATPEEIAEAAADPADFQPVFPAPPG